MTRPNGEKQTLYAGVGYALADRTPEVNELLDSENIRKEFTLSTDKMDVRVIERPTLIKGYGLVRTFYVNVSNSYLGTYTVAALSVFDFPHLSSKYRVFLWVQDHNLTSQDVSLYFGDLLRGIVAPSVQEAAGS